MVWECSTCGYASNDDSTANCTCGKPREATGSITASHPSFLSKYFGIMFFILTFAISSALNIDFIAIQPETIKNNEIPIALFIIPAFFIFLPVALFKLKTHMVSNVLFVLVSLPLLYSSIKGWSNITLDQSPPVHITAIVATKKEVRSWKSTSYVIGLMTSKSEVFEMYLNTPKEYNALSTNDAVSLDVKPGYWSGTWVQRYSKTNL